MRSRVAVHGNGDRILLPAWVAWCLYAALAVVMTWPLVTSLGTRLGGADQDILNVYWGNWWVPKALFSGRDPYATNYLIYPIGFDLTSFAFSPLLAIVAMPFHWLFSSIMAYNLLFLAVVVVSAGAMDQLVRYLTGNPWAALVAGITFGFSPILAGHRAAHLNMATIVWLPWAALLLIRMMREARLSDALALALVARLAFLTRLQVGALTAGFCAVVFLGMGITEGKSWGRRAWGRLALAAGLALLLLSPLLVKVGYRLGQPDAGGAVVEASIAEADVLSYLTPTPAHPLFGRWTAPIYERYPSMVSSYWTYVGFVPLFLAALATLKRPRRAMPWLCVSLGFFILALGSKLRFNGEVYPGISLPYGWLGDLFAVIGFDRPDRFNLGLASGVAVLAGLGADWLGSRLWRPWLLGVIGSIVLFEYLGVPMKLLDAPPHSPFYDQMAADGEPYAVVDLPLTRAAGEIHRYYQTIHGKPIVGGWDHRVPEEALSFIDIDPLLSSWRGLSSESSSLFGSLEHLRTANVRYIILHKDQLGGIPDVMQQLYLAIRSVYEDDNVYVLPTDVVATPTLDLTTTFDGGISLVRPWVTTSTAGGIPGVKLNTCWFSDGGTVRASGCTVSLISPQREVITQKVMDFPTPYPQPTCQQWFLALGSNAVEGAYEIDVTPFIGHEPLDITSITENVHLTVGPDGNVRAWLGTAYPTSFDASIELLGYRIQASDSVLLIDTTWRGLTDHQGSYMMFLQLLDPVSRLPVTRSSDDVLPLLTWQEGSVVTDHRMITINDVSPGQYELAVGVYPSDRPDQRITAYVTPKGDTWPGGQIILRPRVLVQPDAWRSEPEVTDERVTVYTQKGTSGYPAAQAAAQFGPGIALQGYRIDETPLVPGQPFDLSLYWEAEDTHLLDTGYKVFVHVIDDTGQLVAQHDGDPVGGQRPTTTWRDGDRILDTHTVTWSAQVQGSHVRIMVGMYDPQTMERLPSYDADGTRLADDRLELGRVQVGAK